MSTVVTQQVTTRYEWGEHVSSYEREDTIFCPNCGQMGVWTESGAGDYYVGPTSLCTACSYVFHLPCSGVANYKPDQEAIKQLRASCE